MPRPYTVDAGAVRRFDARNTVFARSRRDRRAGTPGTPPDRLLLAEARAARVVQERFAGAYSDGPLHEAGPDATRHGFASPAEASAGVKAVARRTGAAFAGCARIDPLWLYSHHGGGREVALPKGVGHVVVMAVAMDAAEVAKSPSAAASAETARGYSRMAAVAATVAEYLRRLGWRAISCGNDTALSIPLAVDAGLGVMGRSGLLLTRGHGACLRLCKVFTDLPLEPDAPEPEGAEAACGACGLCAEACPVGAISSDPEPSFGVLGDFNSPGVLRWAVDADACHTYWRELGHDCSNCIAACPYPLE
ncbi:MAG: 4Fe-4S double cluster binding domain-containing protein [Planctomycetota bacterium]